MRTTQIYIGQTLQTLLRLISFQFFQNRFLKNCDMLCFLTHTLETWLGINLKVNLKVINLSSNWFQMLETPFHKTIRICRFCNSWLFLFIYINRCIDICHCNSNFNPIVLTIQLLLSVHKYKKKRYHFMLFKINKNMISNHLTNLIVYQVE